MITISAIACIASVSVRFRWKEQGMKVKDRVEDGASKRAGREWGLRKEGNACRHTSGFWKPPTWPVMPEFVYQHLMLSMAVIIDQLNVWPSVEWKIMNFRGCMGETKLFFSVSQRKDAWSEGGNNRTVAIQKLLLSIHYLISNLDWVAMQFSIVDVASV